jgi:uncharacterized iron-regulated protein/poly(3-hydroxybutyrate) depolymerase
MVRYLFILMLFMGTADDCFAQTDPPLWAAPSLDQAIVIRDGKTKQTIAWDDFIAELTDSDVVFLGETHTDETTHRFQLAVYDALLKVKDKQVVLGMEMFERDVQPTLDWYLAGDVDEKEFLKAARPWQNYREAYRPLVELAKENKVPVLATNFPAPLRKRLMMEGPGLLKKLEGTEKQQVPREFHPNTPSYWQRVDNATRGHQGMMGPQTEEDRLYSTQSLWDNSMGEACADALNKFPGHLVLHVNGGFHSAYGDGTAHQLRVRKPAAKIKTVAIVPTDNPSTISFDREGSADFIVAVESRATNLDQGARTVRVGGELKYQFHLPQDATEEKPVPLLIWLPEDGLTAEEGMEYGKALVGDQAAIAVIDAPYKQLGEDLAIGRRWCWPESFTEDAFTAAAGIEEVWAYLLRHYPIDPERVVIAGEGAGATVAALATVHADRMNVKGVAFSPRQYVKLKDVPLPEFHGNDQPPRRSLVVVGEEGDRKWWDAELEQYRSTDMECDWLEADSNESLAQLQAALDITPTEAKHANKRHYLVLEHDSPRARHWARLQALWLEEADDAPIVIIDELPQDGEVAEVSTEIKLAKLSQTGVLPTCPGPFGGTTVLVLPDSLTESEIKKWLELEKNDPLAKASRFHRLRIARSTGERALENVLTKLKSENRTNVLIVPAEFFASPNRLRELQSQVRPFEDMMTIQWSPGLGGRRGAL